jgi:RNA polymerase sigma factor (sigma-70 family)
MTLEALVEQARNGNREALEEVVRAIQDRVYNLALRFLWHPADAEDAAQEILIRVVTNLGGFRGESRFTTWVFQVASHYLRTTRRRRMEQAELNIQEFARDLEEGLQDPVEDRLLVEEVKIGCTHALLLCLDRDHRLAYILGEIFEIPGEEAAQILQITPEAFRKRLSRARRRIGEFLRRWCGIVNPQNTCRCARRVTYAIQTGRVDPNHLLFVNRPTLQRQVRRLELARDAAALYRSHPDYVLKSFQLTGGLE